MHLKKLSLLNFKNFADAELEFSPGINCLVGNNGVGKTNVLDAIHYLCLCKSYFNPVDSLNIRFGEEFAVIQGEFIREGKSDEVFCSIHRNRNKVFKRSKREYERLSEHIGLFPAIMISPEDIALITDGSEERRKLLNNVIAQYDRSYLEDVLTYNKLLARRNKVLRSGTENPDGNAEMLAVYNIQMEGPAARIYSKRADYAERMIPVFSDYYGQIAPQNERVELRYASQLAGTDFIRLQAAMNEKDRVMQYTTGGVHRDDLQMLLNGHPIRRSASQGQQKTFLVTLKLAQYEFIRAVNPQPPLLLLDDVFDKFDENRVRQIIRMVSEKHFGQIFITHTDEMKMLGILKDMAEDYRVYNIRDSSVVLKASAAL